MRNVEILAPAGSYDGLVGAVNGGCDAVYVGGSMFGARAFADNFDEEAMLRAIDYVHFYDKKIYMTVNTLLHNDELEDELFRYLKPYYMQGLDAVIVQDIGVLNFIHRNFPKIPIHASTQMTFTTQMGGELLKDYGVSRFVTSRELGLEELRNIRQKTDLEIETFVHGALCYCYSGQCFMSSMIGGRSGNRGRCAQPCRMQYQVETLDGKKVKTSPYVLSPKDICTLKHIPALVDAGIDSFKIEGRMKRPEYAAYTAFLYRKYTDLYLEYGKDYESFIRKHEKEMNEDYMGLMDLYNRGGFSSGYFYERNGKKLMSMERPNHSGVLVGTVSKMKKNRAVIKLCENIYGQDVLEFRSDDGKAIYEYTVKDDVSLKEGYTETNTKPGSIIKIGTKVYRTRRNQLLEYIKDNILDKRPKKGISFEVKIAVGQPLELTCKCDDVSVSVVGNIVDAAKSQPMSEEKIRKSLEKLTDTKFFLKECNIAMEGAVFVPVGQLNELRRNGIQTMEDAISATYRRDVLELEEKKYDERELFENKKSGEALAPDIEEKVCFKTKHENEQFHIKYRSKLSVMVENMSQFSVSEKQESVSRIYLDLGVWDEKDILKVLNDAKKDIWLAMPAIIRSSELEEFEEALNNVFVNHVCEKDIEKIFGHNRLKGLLIKNFEAAGLYLKYMKNTDVEARLDYNMYSFNKEAKQFWKNHGIVLSTAAVEMNGYEWKKNGCADQEIIVYGRTAVMTSAQCVQKNVLGCNKTPGFLVMRDKFDKEYAGRNCCKYCYNQIFEKTCTSLHSFAEEIMELKPEGIRVSLLDENEMQTEKILTFIEQRFLLGEEAKCPFETFETGHFRKGVR